VKFGTSQLDFLLFGMDDMGVSSGPFIPFSRTEVRGEKKERRFGVFVTGLPNDVLANGDVRIETARFDHREFAFRFVFLAHIFKDDDDDDEITVFLTLNALIHQKTPSQKSNNKYRKKTFLK